MKLQLLPALALAVVLSACNGSDTKPAETKKVDTSKPGENPLTAPVDYLGAIAKVQKASISRLDQAKLIDAIQKFEAGEGRAPKDLEELVTAKYIAAIPPAPAGMKLEYNAADASFKYVPVAPAPAPAAKK